MHSVKLGYLVCAVTVHLLLFLFECHGNKEYVRALACVRACVRTCTCDLGSKRESFPLNGHHSVEMIIISGIYRGILYHEIGWRKKYKKLYCQNINTL